MIHKRLGLVYVLTFKPHCQTKLRVKLNDILYWSIVSIFVRRQFMTEKKARSDIPLIPWNVSYRLTMVCGSEPTKSSSIFIFVTRQMENVLTFNGKQTIGMLPKDVRFSLKCCSDWCVFCFLFFSFALSFCFHFISCHKNGCWQCNVNDSSHKQHKTMEKFWRKLIVLTQQDNTHCG